MPDTGRRLLAVTNPLPALAFTAASALALASCSSQSGPTSPPVPPQQVVPTDALAGPVLAADPKRATFHGFDSQRVVAAAMTYPSAAIAVEPAAPLSLTASDGTGLALVRLDARAVIDGPLAFTELHLRFHNPENRVIEGRFAITLPPAATISRLAMKLTTGWQEAEVVEKQLARRAYEDFLHRRQDPALLEKEAGNEFRARIFPIPARGDKDIIISYSQPLVRDHTGEATYRLPLRGLPAIADLQVRAQIGKPGDSAGAGLAYRTERLARRGERPTADFTVSVPSGIAGLASDELLALRVRPELSAKDQKISSLLLLIDTSASRAPGFSRHVTWLGQVLAELRTRHGAKTKLELAAFDQVVVPLYRGTLGGVGKAQLDAVRAHRPLGASNLSAALAWASTRPGRARVVVVGDAIATMGPTGADDLSARVRALGPATTRLDMLLAGGIRDEDMAARLARGNLANDGVIANASSAPSVVVGKLSRTTVSNVQVAVAGAQWVWPTRLDGLQPGDEALIFASLQGGASSARSDAARVTLSGPIAQDVRIPLTPVARPLLERAAMAAHIARLTSRRDELPRADKDKRNALKERIVQLSSRYRVLSDFTALLVLETEADYVRYGIDRRSLADILTVGERGVEVRNRAAPVLMIAAPDKPKPPVKRFEVAKKEVKKIAREKEVTETGVRDPRPAWGDDDDDKSGESADEWEDTDGLPEPADAAKVAESDHRAERRLVEERLRTTSSRLQAPRRRPRHAQPSPDSEAVRRGADQPSAASDGAMAPPAVPAPEPEPAPGPRASNGSALTRNPTVRRPPASTAAADSQLTPHRPRGRVAIPKPDGPPPYSGKLAAIMDLLGRNRIEQALAQSLGWQSEEPGDVMALIALGESLERAGRRTLAARAYGSIIDLFPSRADMRRFAGERLERLDALGHALAADSYAKAVEQRPDHLTGHRLLAYALVRLGAHQRAFAAVEAGLAQRYPSGRFAGGVRILREDLGIVGAAWLRARPADEAEIRRRLAAADASLATQPSLRFVLSWETDANDVDFHIYDGNGGHAYYSDPRLPSGGELYADVTTGYGPECFTIQGAPTAYPYHLQIHYYSRGPMGYGMGKLQIVEHDGSGGLRLEERPFVVMNDRAYVDLGKVSKGPTAAIAR